MYLLGNLPNLHGTCPSHMCSAKGSSCILMLYLNRKVQPSLVVNTGSRVRGWSQGPPVSTYVGYPRYLVLLVLGKYLQQCS